MRFPRPKETPEATFDLTNMIDVILLLIIFFMLSAQFARSNQAPMDLPRETGEDPGAENELSMVIELGRDGSLGLGGEKVELDRLVQLVSADAARMGTKADLLEITIRADRTCAAGHLNTLVAALARTGVRRWKLATGGEGGA